MRAYLDIRDPAAPRVLNSAGDTVGDVQISAAVLDAWSEDELAGIGVARALQVSDFDPASAVPTGTFVPWLEDGRWVLLAETRPRSAEDVAQERAAGWNSVRESRNGALIATDALIRRHQEQVELVAAGLMAAPTLTAEQWTELLAYRQALRDVPAENGADDGDPLAVAWPGKPAFLD